MAKNVFRGQKCVFCGRPADSREHVFPKWLRDYVAADLSGGNHSQAITDFDASSGTFIVSPPRVIRQSGGSVMTRRLPVVCQRICNGGWMSRLEKSVKLWLGPMTQGAATPLDGDRQRELAVWAEKIAMIWETSDPGPSPKISSTQEQRNHIRQYQHPSPLTEVWLGRSAALQWQARPLHFGAAGAARSNLAAQQASGTLALNWLRWDVIGIGNVMLLVTGTTDASFSLKPTEALAVGGFDESLQRIWPVEQDTVRFPKDAPWIGDQFAFELTRVPWLLAEKSVESLGPGGFGS